MDLPFRELVANLAARTATPGGGTAAACTAAMGAALLLMVVRFSRGKKANEAREPDLERAERDIGACLSRLLPMGERDGAAFGLVTAAYKLPKGTEAEAGVRQRAIQQAMVGAMVVPEEALCAIRDVFVALEPVVICIGRSLASDCGAGVELLRAAAESSELMVRANASYLDDRALADAALERIAAIRAHVRRQHDIVREHVDRCL